MVVNVSAQLSFCIDLHKFFIKSIEICNHSLKMAGSRPPSCLWIRQVACTKILVQLQYRVLNLITWCWYILISFRGTIQILSWNKINLNHVYPWEFHDLLQFLGPAAIPGAEPPKWQMFLVVLGALQDLVVPQVSEVPPQLILHVHILERVYWY